MTTVDHGGSWPLGCLGILYFLGPIPTACGFAPGFAPGFKYLTLIRIYKEGFDIDNYSNQDFNQLRWNSWALDRSTFNTL